MKFKRFVSMAVLQTKKHSPLILLCSGLVGYGVTAYIAYNTKEKVENIVEEVEALQEDGQPVDNVEVGMSMLKAVGPAAIAFTLSTVSIVLSYKVQNGRIAALAGALATSQAGKIAIEERMKEKLGEAVYNEIMNTEQKEVTFINEDGEEETSVQSLVREVDEMRGLWFSDSSKSFKDDHSYNMAMIDDISNTIDLILFSKGYILLNEVRQRLGFEPTRAGALLGWTSMSNFQIEKRVHNIFEESKGQFKNDIFVAWPEPKYIYDQINFKDGFSDDY